ncbi:hypothetical protein Tco_0382729 [Tanacetum coccineum]
MGIWHAKTHTLRGKVFDESRAEVTLGQVKTHALPLYQGFPCQAYFSSPINRWTWTSAKTPENMPLTNRAFTSANLDPMISPAFVEANYEVLESFLRERRKQMPNEDLRTKLEYFSEEYDEERNGTKTCMC